MIRLRAALFLAAPAALLAIACTVETQEVVSQPSPTLPSTATADGGVRAKPTGATCQAYLACVAEVTPELIGAATEDVGSTSACWRAG